VAVRVQEGLAVPLLQRRLDVRGWPGQVVRPVRQGRVPVMRSPPAAGDSKRQCHLYSSWDDERLRAARLRT
jgi:hypothetical protein